MTVFRSVMLGCGSYLPNHILTNEDLARKVDTSDEWIVQRTGMMSGSSSAPASTNAGLRRRANIHPTWRYVLRKRH